MTDKSIYKDVLMDHYRNPRNKSDLSDADAVHRQIILDFRLPQVLTALLSGAALGTAGLLMQTVFPVVRGSPTESAVFSSLLH